ncbi:MAG: EAL domain-containing protein [Thiohalorhabdus sp.]|uniref:EAL domain-containing protein n=1 Tax=Thiohalorhabdus sp. TaxID=3094134 RepID=UPI002FC30A07
MALFATEGDQDDGLLAKADIALHTAKYAGRNRHPIFSPGDEALGRMRAKIQGEERIRRAQEGDRLVLHYQPICRLPDHSVSHFQVLIRMRGEDGELVSPAAFLDTAERFGMIRYIDHWVVNHALAVQGRSLREERPVSLAVNLAGLHIGRGEVLDRVTRALEESGADPRALCSKSRNRRGGKHRAGT